MEDFPKINWFKVVGIFVLLTVVLPISASALGLITLPFFKFGKKVELNQQAIDIVYDAERCIGINTQYQKIKANTSAIRNSQIPNAEKALKNYEANLPADRTQWSRTQQEQDNNLQTNVTGLQQQLSSLEADYIALTARDDAQPCLGSLPLFIDLK